MSDTRTAPLRPPEPQGKSAPQDAAVRKVLTEARQEILVFLHQRLRDRDEAEDVLQRFTLRALERAGQLRDVETVRGWLGRVLDTTLLDHHRAKARRQKRERPLSEGDLETASVAPDPELDGAVCNCLYRVLPTLKPSHAEIVWRADLLGEPREDLAARLGIPVNTLNVRLHRGRAALRRGLDAVCGGCCGKGHLFCECSPAAPARTIKFDANS